MFVPATTRTAQAQTYEVLYTFQGPPNDGAFSSGLVQDAKGNFYGTTQGGGTGCSDHNRNGCGIVFKLDQSGQETILHRFAGYPTDGSGSQARLVRDAAGNLYGTTYYGGIIKCDDRVGYGCGTVFKVDRSGKEAVLYNFFPGKSGIHPFGGLVLDTAGNLYGTAAEGGIHNWGTVFKLDKAGKFSVLFAFTGKADGGIPVAGLIRDKAGNLYGAAEFGGDTSKCVVTGGSGCGTVFKVSTMSKLTVLYQFKGFDHGDGEYPSRDLIMDDIGNLYGTTSYGNTCIGTVFKLTKAGKETVHVMPDHQDPSFSGLSLDVAGNLYGTARDPCGGNGVLFKLDKTGHETTLHTFPGGTQGGPPYGDLLRDTAGNFYGPAGGGSPGYGIIFEFTP
jgi:uncharacterized repeat protein (TIGR03803 family)